jgi:hypothetical protein
VAMRDHPNQVTLSVRAGDAVVTDYRLLHGTHANTNLHPPPTGLRPAVVCATVARPTRRCPRPSHLASPATRTRGGSAGVRGACQPAARTHWPT